MATLLSRSSRVFFLVSIVSFLLDRASKVVALDLLAKGDFNIFPGLSFTLAVNTGISFSMFSSFGLNQAWLMTGMVAAVVAALVVIWRFTAHTELADWGYGLIVGGAVGNFVDRLYIGGVVDFIDLYYGAWHWPTFNIADTTITIGFLLLAWEIWHAKTPR